MKIKKLIFILLPLFFTPLNNALAVTIENNKLTPAANCSNLTCVRDNIDQIDASIVKLIGLRLTYVTRAGELKGKKAPIHDQKREDQIIEKVSNLAKKEGYPDYIAKEIYKTLLIQTNQYEQGAQTVNH